MEDISHQEPIQDKYLNQNFIARKMVEGFFRQVTSFVQVVSGEDLCSVLEVGCGEGEILALLESLGVAIEIQGCDIDVPRLAQAQKNLDVAKVSVASIYELPYSDNSYPLVICCEVLEHLEDPYKALTELSRVGSDYFIFSVPNEPLWRILNMCRGKYWGDFGNTPGHLNHWSKAQFVTLISEYFVVEAVQNPMPWTMLLARKRK